MGADEFPVGVGKPPLDKFPSGSAKPPLDKSLSGSAKPPLDKNDARAPSAGGTPDAALVEVAVDLDVPGETKRQARVFVVWAACLALAVALGSAVGAHVADEGSAAQELARSRVAKLKVAVLLGILLPAALTWAVSRHHRRGGRHARRICVDVTADGELRIWGRGYGARIPLEGASVTERLVDVYAGRLGAWRQRRLRVARASRTAARGGVSQIEIATCAVRSDAAEGLPLEGGEGNCVELEREDYELVRAEVKRATQVSA